MKNEYGEMFDVNNINNTLHKFKQYIPKNVHLMSTPLYIPFDKNIDFFREFIWKIKPKSGYTKIIFLVYSLINSKLTHAISGLYDISTNTMDLYDNNGETGSQYFQKGLTQNVFGRTVFNNSPYYPCVNMVYQMTFHIFEVKLEKQIEKMAFTNHDLVPTYCIPTRDGICAFWAMLYILLRSRNVSYSSAPVFIFKVSQNAIKSNQQFQFLIDFCKMTNINKQIKNIIEL